MHIVIYGAGGLGGTYACLLAKAAREQNNGNKVTIIARGKTLEALKDNGVYLAIDRDAGKEEITEKLEVCERYTDVKDPDVVFVCVKSKDTASIAADIKSNLGPNTYLVSPQNGVENEEILLEELGSDRVIAALTYIKAQQFEPGKYLMTGDIGSTTLGELDNRKTDRIQELSKILVDAGFKVSVAENMQKDLWSKLAWNSMFNPISALHEIDLGTIIRDYKDTLIGIGYEAKAIASAQGIDIGDSTVEKHIEVVASNPELQSFKTSMLQDLLNRRPIEIEELLGILLRKGQEFGIETPHAESIYQPLKEKATKLGLL